MPRREFERINITAIKGKKASSNGHWDAEYRQEQKNQKQLNNENRYSVLIKFILKEIDKRECYYKISKSDLLQLITQLLESSKYLSQRFKRRRERNL